MFGLEALLKFPNFNSNITQVGAMIEKEHFWLLKLCLVAWEWIRNNDEKIMVVGCWLANNVLFKFQIYFNDIEYMSFHHSYVIIFPIV